MVALVVVTCALVVPMIALTLLSRRAVKHYHLTEAKLQWLLDALLYRGHDGAVLLVEDRHRRVFVQVRKVIRSGEEPFLQLGFPDAGWSSEFYSKVGKVLIEQGAPIAEVEAEEDGVVAYLLADLGTDTGLAARVVKRLTEEVLQIDLAENGIATLRGISPSASARIGFELI
jgi:hypothetical protein